jgi:hypothetical protein
MNRVKHLGITVAVVISSFLIFSQTVYASIDVGTFDQAAYAYYIDPGTGSLIIQILIGSFVGGLALIGVYRTRVKNFLTNLFTRRRHDKKSEESE